MPRKPRLDTHNGLYHVIAKGNDGCVLFRDPSDYLKFSLLLSDVREKDPHFLLAFCLMPNHVHLLMETLDISLSRIMHRLLLRYAIYFNGKHNRTGHLFQNRFKSKPCKDETYLLQLLVYIHDNPRRAGLVTSDKTYVHSSEQAYNLITGTRTPVDTRRTLELIGPSRKAARRAYYHHLFRVRKQVPPDTEPGSERLILDPLFMDRDDVYAEVPRECEKLLNAGEFDFLQNVPLDQICQWVAEILGVGKEVILGNGKNRSASRARCAFLSISRAAGWRSVDLITECGFLPGTIAYQVGRYSQIYHEDEREKIREKLRTLSDARIA